MRIGVNAISLQYQSGGTRVTFDSLLRALLKADDTHRYEVFTTRSQLPFVNRIAAIAPDRVTVTEILDETDVLPHAGALDLYFSPLNHLHPRLLHVPTVSTLYDIQEKFFPEYFDRAELLFRAEEYPEIARASTTVVTISQFCKQSFVDHFGIDPAKIEVLYLAPQDGLVAPDDGAWSRGELPATYLFYPANWYKHKNHRLLLDALPRLRQDFPDLHLVFTGTPRPNAFSVDAEIARRGLADRCRVYGDLAPAELRHLYRRATAVVLPTLFEGFGIPAIEALAFGVPLVCSDLPVLREVLGDHDAALFFPPDDAGALVAQVRRLLRDPAERARLSSLGPALAARFTWDAAARQTLDIFAAAAARFRPALPDPPPRIALLVRGTDRDLLRHTRESIAACDYPNAVYRCDPDASYEQMLAFARQQHADLAGLVLAGNRLTPTALHAVAAARLADPEKSGYLGEAYEWHTDKRRRAVAYLRFTGDGLWKFEAYPYPEMLFVNVARAPDAPRDLLLGPDRAARLHLLRRNLADCRHDSVPRALRRAARPALAHHRQDDNRPVPVSPLRRFESLAKRLSMSLPLPLQHAGRRLWFRLTRR